VICNYTPVDGEFASMAGLLHDVGIAGTLLALSEGKGKRRTPPELISIWPAVDRVHQRAGDLMAQHWELPSDLRLAISAPTNRSSAGLTRRAKHQKVARRAGWLVR
jgi:HD-like signal output (HDOD) protein